MMIKFLISLGLLLLAKLSVFSQTDLGAAKLDKRIGWYEKINVRGYTQFRYNRLFETNPKLKCEQCDRSWGENGGFSIRRLRLVFFGQISERVFYYFQPDFSNAVSSAQGIAQIRDMYIDLGFDKKNQYRLRIGQSKVPFGFENLQSSQNRITLDRADALNSGIPNERDLGLFFYYSPVKIRQLYSALISDGLKGSGDYGVLAVGLYNGQSVNRLELNNRPHFVARITYPWKINNQIIETGIQMYSGNYVLASEQLSKGVKYKNDLSFIDRRIAASVTWYPKPLGIQAEYNIGQSPEYNSLTDSIKLNKLKGGYVQAFYKANVKSQVFIPFVKYHYYKGGKKAELDARSYTVKELEIGVEWQIIPQLELVIMYTISDRRFEDFVLQSNHQFGRLLRIQTQVNF